MPRPEERIITISTATIVKAVVAILALVFVWVIRDILALVFIALILTALMLPFVQWLRKYYIPAPISVLLFYGLLVGAFVLIALLVIPQLIGQFSQLGSLITSSWNAALNQASVAREFITRYGLQENVQNAIISAEAYAGQLVSNIFTTISGVVGGIAALILVLVLTYYMVVEEREAVRWFKSIIPEQYQEFAANLLYEVERKFSRWIVGQLVLCLIIGVFYFIGLTILGIDGALLLSVFAGFLEIVPYLGPILSGIVIVLVALTQSPVHAIGAAVLMIIIQELENNVLVPKVMQKAVGLNPVVSIIALLVGAKLFGFVGILLSIPVATGAAVVISEYMRFMKNKDKSTSL